MQLNGSHRRQALAAVAGELVAAGKGILAADESSATMTKRLLAVGAESTPELRRRFRELLITTPGTADHISGVILCDETLRQPASDGATFPELLVSRGMITGIKVDTGAKALAGTHGEKITEGLDGLRERLGEYHELGARFAKWRATIAIGDGRPSRYCIATNAHALGRYAALCQEADTVPIVEPEVLMTAITRSSAPRRSRATCCEPCSQNCLTRGWRSKGSCSSPTWSSPATTAQKGRRWRRSRRAP
jgi:fructose-bisphosphate aldolase, class I